MNVKSILRDLIGFNTIKDKENKEIMDYIENLLKKKNFRTEYKDKCLIMSINETQELGFLGHTDTIDQSANWTKNPFEMQEIDGKLYGLGSCDMKGGIAAILAAVIETDWRKVKSGIKLYFTYDEEIGFSGIKTFVDMNEKFPDNMVVGEPTYNKLMNGSKGLIEIKATFNGVSAHASTPDKGENAIEKCIGFLNEIILFYNELKNIKNPNFDIPYTTMNIGKIEGGKTANIVPDFCSANIDFRTIEVEHNDLILKRVAELAEKYNGECEVIDNIKSFLNLNETNSTTNFITEASFIEAKNKYILGTGPLNLHTADEFITEESLNKLVEQYKEMIRKF